MTATLHTDGDRSTLRFERHLAHGLDRVWRAVTDPAELEQWFPSAVVYEPRAGASMQFDFGGEHGIDALPGEVLEFDPPRVFAFAWGKDVLRFELAGDERATQLVFTHSFAHEPGKPARDAAGWAACWEAFDALLDGGPKPAGDRWTAHEQGYVELFGALTVDVDGDNEHVHLTGPLLEVDGRPAVNATVGDRSGLLVVRDPGLQFADGAVVEVREGTVAEPGAVRATGVLSDPLAGRRHATIGR
jgi:uncharacterized protein YndB with AHSA1/START domain